MALYIPDAAYLPLEQVMAAKPVFVAAYTDGQHGYTAAVIAQLRGEGISILANHENAANELLGGYSAGVAAAQRAMAAVEAWGMPADGSCALFFSVDVSVPIGQFPIIDAAFDGIRHALQGRFLAGVYSEGALIDHLWAGERIDVKGWLSASSSFIGYNPASPHVGLVQQVGTSIPGTDMNEVTDIDNLGLWWATPHSRPQVNQTEDDMGFRVIECSKEPIRAALGIWAVGGGGTRVHVPTPGPTGFEGVYLGLPECLNTPDANGVKSTQDVDAQTWDAYFTLAGDPDPLHPTPSNTVTGVFDASGIAQALIKLLPSSDFPQQAAAAMGQALASATFTGKITVAP